MYQSHLCIVPEKVTGFTPPLDLTVGDLSSELLEEFIKEKYNNDEKKFLEIIKTHFIDLKAYSYLIEDNFPDFVNTRKENILNKIKQLIGYKENEQVNLIKPNAPFSNNMIFLNMLQNCNTYIYWIDKYFSEKGLELLAERLQKGDIKNVKVLLSNEKATDTLREHIKDFINEFKNTDCQFKIITDAKLKSNLHDRFIVSDFNAYNIPSPDTLARGQLSEISESKNRDLLLTEFNNIWDNSLNIINQWELILKTRSN